LTAWRKIGAAWAALFLLGACALLPNTNDDTADVARATPITPGHYAYRTALTGVRRQMAHDPITALASSRAEYQLDIYTNTIEGRIPAQELALRFAGGQVFSLIVSGYIGFSGDRLVVNLGNVRSGCERPSSYNGMYKVARRDARIEEIPTTAVSGRPADAPAVPPCK
jgi:hypothetical protein